MTKIAIICVLLAVSVTVQGAPTLYDDLVQAITDGGWDRVRSLLTQNLSDDDLKNLQLTGVRDLKPPKGGHVYGKSEFTFHSASDVNGQRSQQSRGHKIINEDGKVEEYDFEPSLSQQREFFRNLGVKSIFDHS